MPQALTQAERAVRHILHRCVTDPNFRWYMMGTESLQLCLLAEAARLKTTPGNVRKKLEAAIAEVQDDQSRAEVHILRDIVRQIPGDEDFDEEGFRESTCHCGEFPPDDIRSQFSRYGENPFDYLVRTSQA